MQWAQKGLKPNTILFYSKHLSHGMVQGVTYTQLPLSSYLTENTAMSITNTKQLLLLGKINKCTWFVPKVSALIFLCTNWQRSTSLMYVGTLVVTLAACPYLFQLDWLSQSCATAVCVWSCFLTSLRL